MNSRHLSRPQEISTSSRDAGDGHALMWSSDRHNRSLLGPAASPHWPRPSRLILAEQLGCVKAMRRRSNRDRKRAKTGGGDAETPKRRDASKACAIAAQGAPRKQKSNGSSASATRHSPTHLFFVCCYRGGFTRTMASGPEAIRNFFRLGLMPDIDCSARACGQMQTATVSTATRADFTASISSRSRRHMFWGST